LPMASALNIEVGDILTQAQLDALDIDNLDYTDFDCQWHPATFFINKKWVGESFSCLNLADTNEGDYIVIRDGDTARYSVPRALKQIADGYSLAEVIDMIESAFNKTGKNWFASLKEDLIEKQTNTLNVDSGDLTLGF